MPERFVPIEVSLHIYPHRPSSYAEVFYFPTARLIALKLRCVAGGLDAAAADLTSATRPIPRQRELFTDIARESRIVKYRDVDLPGRRGIQHIDLFPTEEVVIVDETDGIEVIFDIAALAYDSIIRRTMTKYIETLHGALTIGLNLLIEARNDQEGYIVGFVAASEPLPRVNGLLDFHDLQPVPSMRTVDAATALDSSSNPAAVTFGRFGLSILSDTYTLFGEQPYRVIDVYYATNRKQIIENGLPSFGTERAPNLQLGRCSVGIPATHEPGRVEGPLFGRHLVWRRRPDRHITLLDVLPLDEATFVAKLKETLQASTGNELLIFVHGFNNTFHEAVARAAQLFVDIRFSGAVAAFTWPSAAAATLPGYSGDEDTVMVSVRHFHDFLAMLKEQCPATSVHIVAHSMGNRLLLHSLSRLAVAAQVLFSEVVIAAPDIDADLLRQLSDDARKVAERLTVYASARDVPLWFSEHLHGNTRAGNSPDALQTLGEHIDAVDTSDLARAFSLNHFYSADEPWALLELQEVICHHYPPDKRFAIEQRDERTWKFRVGLRD